MQQKFNPPVVSCVWLLMCVHVHVIYTCGYLHVCELVSSKLIIKFVLATLNMYS